MLNVIIKNKNLGLPAYLAFPKYSLQTRLKIFKKTQKQGSRPACSQREAWGGIFVCV